MSRRTVPEQTVVTCDGCGTDNPHAFRLSCQASFSSDAVALDGVSWSRRETKFDFCDVCGQKFVDIANQVFPKGGTTHG